MKAAPHAASRRSLRGFRWDVFASVLVGAVVALVSMGDTRVRLANTILDDNPVVFAHHLVDRSLFARDVLSTYGDVFGKTTIQNWLPAILLDQFGIDPHFPSVAFVFLQHVLLAAALFLLAVELTGNRLTGWMTVVFAFAALPWRWNLAGYGSIMPWPYPGHLVVPLLLFSVLALARQRGGWMIALLATAALVHPAMSLCAVAVAGIFLLDEWRVERRLPSLLWAAALVFPVLVSIGPALLLTPASSASVSQSELMEVLRANGHMNPLESTRFLGTVIPTFLGFCILALLACRFPLRTERGATGSGTRVRRLCMAAGAAMVILSTAHALAMWVGVPRVAQIAGTRSSLIFVMITLPVVLHYLLIRVEADRVAERWAAVGILVLLATQQYGLFVGPLVALLICDLDRAATDGNVRLLERSRMQLAAALVLIAWVGIVIAAGALGLVGGERISGRPLLALLAPGTYLGAAFAVAALAITTVALLPAVLDRLRVSRPGRSYIAVAAILVVGTIAARHAYQTGQETEAPVARANFDAQIWARNNTEPNALFLVAEEGLPWRTASLRSAVRMEPDAFYIYSGSRLAKRRYYDLPLELSDAFPTDTVERILAFATAFDVDFIVTRATVELGLDAAYRNDLLAIHAVGSTAARAAGQ